MARCKVMPDEPVVLDTPVEGAEPEVDLNPEGSQPSGEGDVEPSGEHAPEPEGGEETPEPGADGGGEPQDNRLIPKYIRALKDTDPEGYKRAKADFFQTREYRSVYPTVQAARQDKELVESIGGREGLEKLQGDVEFFHTAQSQFMKGDPAFVADFWEEDPIAAALHVQPMLEQFQKHDPDGYSTTLAKTWKKEFDSVGLMERGLTPLMQTIEAMADSPQKKSALSIVKSIIGWQQSIEQVASKAEDPRVKSLLAERTKRQETAEQSAQEEFLKSYKTESVNAVVEDATKVFDSFFRGRKLDKEDRNDLLRDSLRRANQIVEADKAFMAQRDKHLARKDSASAIRLTKSRFATAMTEAVKKTARIYGMNAGPAKAAPQQRQPNGQQPAPKAPAGYVAVNTRPEPEQVDYTRTTRDDITAGKAVLRDGRKVTWAHLRQKAS